MGGSLFFAPKLREPLYLGHMPEAGQGTLTTQLNALLKDILSQVDSQGLRLVSVTDDGYHPSDYSHRVLQKMPDPRRPWRSLEWLRIIDYDHACQYVQQLVDAFSGFCRNFYLRRFAV